MKANFIVFEITFNEKLEFITLKEIDVLKATKKIIKDYPNCIIWSFKAQYYN